MSWDFWKDLAEAKKVEQLAMEVFQSRSEEWSFTNVSDDKEYFHRGDLIAERADGRKVFLEIKADTRIADTGNVYCEEQNYWFDQGKYSLGNMYSNYQIYCVVSESARKIWVIDFEVLRAHYGNANHKYIRVPHKDNVSYGFLFPLYELAEKGGLIATIDY